jgi:hypothetical protein
LAPFQCEFSREEHEDSLVYWDFSYITYIHTAKLGNLKWLIRTAWLPGLLSQVLGGAGVVGWGV